MNPHELELLEQNTLREIKLGSRTNVLYFAGIVLGLGIYLTVMFGLLKLIPAATSYFLGR